MQSTNEYNGNRLTISIFPKADGTFTLYEDEGANNDYLKGQFTEIQFDWNDSEQTLKIGKRSGQFAGMPTKRTFVVKIVGTNIVQSVEYEGEEVALNFK